MPKLELDQETFILGLVIYHQIFTKTAKSKILLYFKNSKNNGGTKVELVVCQLHL